MPENHATPSPEDCPAQLKRAAEYIQKHYAEVLTLEKLASVACYSKYHFHRLFREHFGETVNDHIRRVRLEQAARRLTAEGHATVSQIADACGYSSSQNFAKAFKAYFGCSPSLVRKKPDRYAIAAQPFQRPLKNQPPLAVEIKEAPSCRVAYIRDIGPYHSESNDRAIERLFLWALAAGYADTNPRLISICWSDVETTSPQECVFDACLPVPEDVSGEGEVGIQILPGGKRAVLHVEDTWDQIPVQRQRFLSEWLPASGYRRDEKPLYFIHYNNPHMNRLKLAILDLCLPIRPCANG